MMKICFCSFFTSLILVSNCLAQTTPAVSVFTANFNDHIDPKSRNEIKLLDDRVVAAFKDGNAQTLFSLFSGNLQKVITENQTGDLVKKIQPLMSTLNYTLLDEYLVTTETKGVTQTIFKSSSEDNDYKVNFAVINKETYISLIIYKAGADEFLFTCIYGKYDDGWKLNTMRVGPYKVLDMNSVDFYKKSKESYAQGDIVQAGIYIHLAQYTSLPANKEFVYFKLPEMMDFNKKLAEDAKTKIQLPAKIPGLDTTTKIFDIEPAIYPEGIFPIFKYITTTRLSDTVALKAENDKIKKIITRMFPGVDKGKKYVFFRAYNQVPDGSQVPIQTYGFVMKTEEK